MMAQLLRQPTSMATLCIEAENMDEPLKLVDGNPFLSDKTGKFRIGVFELMPPLPPKLTLGNRFWLTREE